MGKGFAGKGVVGKSVVGKGVGRKVLQGRIPLLLGPLLGHLLPAFFSFVLLLIISFFLIHLIPGGPLEHKLLQAGAEIGTGSLFSYDSASSISEKWKEEWRHHYGFDRPLEQRFRDWLENIFQGNWGFSDSYGEPVLALIVQRFFVTLQFGFVSLLFCGGLGIPIGFYLAKQRKTFIERFFKTLLVGFTSLSPLVLGLTLLLFFAGGDGENLFPLGEMSSDHFELMSTWERLRDRLWHLFLPALSFALTALPSLSLLIKEAMIASYEKPFAKMARARGLSDWNFKINYLLKPKLPLFMQWKVNFLIGVFAGSIVIERIFRLQGMGSLSYQALLDRDYNLLMGIVLFQGVLIYTLRTFSEVARSFLNPQTVGRV